VIEILPFHFGSSIKRINSILFIYIKKFKRTFKVLKELSGNELRTIQKDGWSATPSSSPDPIRFCCPRTACYVVAAPVVLVTSLATATLGCFVNCIAGTTSPNLEQGILLKDMKDEDRQESAMNLGNRSFTFVKTTLDWSKMLYSRLQPCQP